MPMPPQVTQVTRQIDLDVDLARVWHAITDPDELGAWLGSTVEVEVRPGAIGTLVDDEGTLRHARIGEVDPERRLSLRWWPSDGAPSEVAFELCPTESGTRLVVTETALEPTTAQACTAKAAYWEARLDTLFMRVSAAALVR